MYNCCYDTVAMILLCCYDTLAIMLLTFSLCSAANILKKAQACSGVTIALISSSVGKRTSGRNTHEPVS